MARKNNRSFRDRRHSAGGIPDERLAGLARSMGAEVGTVKPSASERLADNPQLSPPNVKLAIGRAVVGQGLMPAYNRLCEVGVAIGAVVQPPVFAPMMYYATAEEVSTGTEFSRDPIKLQKKIDRLYASGALEQAMVRNVIVPSSAESGVPDIRSHQRERGRMPSYIAVRAPIPLNLREECDEFRRAAGLRPTGRSTFEVVMALAPGANENQLKELVDNSHLRELVPQDIELGQLAAIVKPTPFAAEGLPGTGRI